MKKLLFIIAAVTLSVSGITCAPKSDEAILRKEFNLSDSARLISMKISPETTGFFGREGLKIDAVFQLSDEEFRRYSENARASKQWLPLPITKNFLMRMLSIKSSKESIKRSYEESGRPVPEEGSVYNPTEEQMFEQRVKMLPLQVTDGLFIIKTSGRDIMHYPKMTRTQLDKDINDFMLGVLDINEKKLFIKVSSNY